MSIKKSIKKLLIKLLKDDAEIQQLIRDICLIQSIPETPPVQPMIVDHLPQAFTEDLDILNALKADTELCKSWLGELPKNEPQQLKKLMAIAAQWDRVLALWDVLANRCKQEQRGISSTEQQLLNYSLNIHNLIWINKAASLVSADIESKYDYQQHERGTAKGDTISAVWLEGLKNAAGNILKRPLVKTR